MRGRSECPGCFLVDRQSMSQKYLTSVDQGRNYKKQSPRNLFRATGWSAGQSESEGD